MRVMAILFLTVLPAMAQVVGPRTGIADLDTAWDICTRQSGPEFIPLCGPLRIIRQKFPQRMLPPTTDDFGGSDLAYVERVVGKWSGR